MPGVNRAKLSFKSLIESYGGKVVRYGGGCGSSWVKYFLSGAEYILAVVLKIRNVPTVTSAVVYIGGR